MADSTMPQEQAWFFLGEHPEPPADALETIDFVSCKPGEVCRHGALCPAAIRVCAYCLRPTHDGAPVCYRCESRE